MGALRGHGSRIRAKPKPAADRRRLGSASGAVGEAELRVVRRCTAPTERSGLAGVRTNDELGRHAPERMTAMEAKIEKGRALVLVGPQGCGKTRLARELAAAEGPYREIDIDDLESRFSGSGLMRQLGAGR